MTLFGLIIVCTIIILIALWLGFYLISSSIKDKQEIETTSLGHAIEKKLNALDELQERRLNNEIFKLNEKLDDLKENMDTQHLETLKSIQKNKK